MLFSKKLPVAPVFSQQTFIFCRLFVRFLLSWMMHYSVTEHNPFPQTLGKSRAGFDAEILIMGTWKWIETVSGKFRLDIRKRLLTEQVVALI